MPDVAAVLHELAPDVVGLQEVLSSEEVPSVGQLEALAEATGLTAVAGSTLAEADARYGNGVLLRRPPAAIARHDLSVPGREPRGALEVVLDGEAGPTRVINTHLGLARRERRVQIERLREIVAARPEPVLALIGDVNEWRPFSDPLRELADVLQAVPRARTFPAHRPVVALDRIWVGRGYGVRASGAHRSPRARKASDHLPFFADVGHEEIGPGGADVGREETGPGGATSPEPR